MIHTVTLTDVQAAFVIGQLKSSMDEAAEIVASHPDPTAVVRAGEVFIEASVVWEAILLVVSPPGGDPEEQKRLENVRYMRDAIQALVAEERKGIQ